MAPGADLVATVTAGFTGWTGRRPGGVWAAPGRINLIGEHTDYNDGFVLPIALPQHTVVAAGTTPGPELQVRSWLDGRWEQAAFDPATTVPGERTGWIAYVAGVAWALREIGHPAVGGHLVIAGDVPLGAGLSSSASLTSAVACALLGGSGRPPGPAGMGPTDVARVAQRAESGYVGVPCGPMDQLAAMHGQAGRALLIDTRSAAVERLPFDLATRGLALLAIDTNAPHRHAGGEYAARRADCEAAVAALGVASLREVAPGAGSVERLPDVTLRRRVRHVVSENERVLAVAARLRAGGDLRSIGPLLTASHGSLRDDYEVSCPELDTAVEAALGAGAWGARLTGGGFGGCAIALVDADRVPAVRAAVVASFAAQRLAAPSFFVAPASDGARRLA